ncbi:hypothetical protein AGMMS49531_03250 [Endomicrobiia bacterium]|nr:hypothetical protein AGMMS49531_03250 [Endomicrobiia bacterium]
MNISGGYVGRNGDANNNKVTINDGKIKGDVYGGYVFGDGDAKNNIVAITNATVGENGDVYGGCVHGDGNAEKNEVTITSATVGENICGGCVHGDGDANNNKITINGGRIEGGVFGGCVIGDGDAKNNKVTINGGRIEGNVCGGFVRGNYNGDATGNIVTISGTPEFGDNTNLRVLCGGICANDRFDAFTGNTLVIKETKAITVRGISNFENYEFYLPQGLKAQEPILIANDGGCSWDKSKPSGDDHGDYSDPCPLKLSKTNITIYPKEAIEKETKYTLIRSLQGFDGISKKFTSPPPNKGPVVYKWGLEIVDNKDLATTKDLVVTLAQKSIAPATEAL